MTTTLRPPLLDELAELSALCIRSKAHWGYDTAFMRACVDELTLTAEQLDTDAVIVLEDENGVAGLGQVSCEDGAYYLEKLFVDPGRMGEGHGQSLFDWAVHAARRSGAREIIIEADPDAAPFYEHMGCVRAGDAPSGSVAGRVLPRFVYPL